MGVLHAPAIGGSLNLYEGNAVFDADRLAPQLRQLTNPRAGEGGQPWEPPPGRIGLLLGQSQQPRHLVVVVRQLPFTRRASGGHVHAVRRVLRHEFVGDAKIEERTQRRKVRVR